MNINTFALKFQGNQKDPCEVYDQNNSKCGLFSPKAIFNKLYGTPFLIQDQITSRCDRTTLILHRTYIWLKEREVAN